MATTKKHPKGCKCVKCCGPKMPGGPRKPKGY